MRSIILSVVLLNAVAATAQWVREPSVPETNVPSIHLGDHLYIGTDSAVYQGLGTSALVRSSDLPSTPDFVDAVITFDGCLYAGTGTQGVFRSVDSGVTWQPFSDGLGGMGGMNIYAFAEFAGDLYCGTVGSGVFRLNGSTWQHFGTLQNQLAGNVVTLQVVGDTLWAGAGGNGYLWRVTAGDTDWTPILVAPVDGTEHMLSDIIKVPGGLVVGGNYGVYRSSDQGNSWTPVPGVGGAENIRLVYWGDTLFAARNTAFTRIYTSLDHGLTWTLREQLPLVFRIATHAGRLYTGRIDGLWYLEAGPTSIEEPLTTLEFRLYPVPTSTDVTVLGAWSGPADLQVLDAEGRLVHQQLVRNTEEHLALSMLPTGVYTVLMRAGTRVGQGRVVVQR